MFFHEILEGQPDPVFGLAAAFQADPRPEKINLLVGIYKDEALRSELMPSVKKAKETVADSQIDYLPIDGLREFCDLLGESVFGKQDWAGSCQRVYGAQGVGGTGALYLGGAFLAQEVTKNVAIPNPTWPNHRSIFERAGSNVLTYSYYNKEKHGFDFEAMKGSLLALPEKTAVLLQAVCHNPTGCDPSLEEWRQISQLMLDRHLVPFFDCAYHGLGDGLDRDVQSIRLFKEMGHEMLVAYSCSKNFSLYCQRVGALFIVNENERIKSCVASQVKRIIRAIYSNPPAHGARVVAHVLKDLNLRREWEKDLGVMRHRLVTMREELIGRLCSRSKKVDFDFLRAHRGMFSYLDLEPAMAKQMMDQFAIYMIGSGRINVAGLTEKNIDRVVNSLLEVC
jgi:aspartate aminotransferase